MAIWSLPASTLAGAVKLVVAVLDELFATLERFDDELFAEELATEELEGATDELLTMLDELLATLDELLAEELAMDELVTEELEEAITTVEDATDELFARLDELRIEDATDELLATLEADEVATELVTDDFELDELDAGELLATTLDVAVELTAGVVLPPPPPPPHALKVKLNADRAAS